MATVNPNLPESEFTDTVVSIKRVSKKTQGGNQIAFTALVVSGDQKSRVGVGLGKAKSVADAIKKATNKARNTLTSIKITQGTIPSSIRTKFKAAKIMLRPGRPGSGLIAGSSIRAVVQAAGIKDIATKIICSKNKSINVWAALKALKTLSK